MLNSFKLALVVPALVFSLEGLAQEKICTKENSVYPCGIEFTSIGTIPQLSDLYCNEPQTVSYTIQNQGNTDTSISLSLTEVDALSDPTAVVFNGTTTCPNPGNLAINASCNIVLDFQPCVDGDLDWDLTVTPDSTQRPLVLPLTGTVAHDPAMAYIVNYGSGLADGSGSISICEVKESDGTLDTCTNFPTYGVTLAGPASIVLTADRTFAYITNFGNYDGTEVTICPVNPTNYTLGSSGTPCYNTDGNGLFNQPNGVALSYDNNTLFVANGGNGGGSTGNQIVSCPINGDGSLGTCVMVDGGAGPNGVFYTLAPDSTPLVYAIDYYTTGSTGNGIVRLFDATNPTGLTPYSPPTDEAGGSLSGPIDIGFNPTGTIAYIVNLGDNPGTITFCPVNNDGTFDELNCQNTAVDNLLEYPAGLWITATQFYVSNNAGYITLCNVSGVDGSLSGCQNLTDPTFNAPNDVFVSHFPY